MATSLCNREGTQGDAAKMLAEEGEWVDKEALQQVLRRSPRSGLRERTLCKFGEEGEVC